MTCLSQAQYRTRLHINLYISVYKNVTLANVILYPRLNPWHTKSYTLRREPLLNLKSFTFLNKRTICREQLEVYSSCVVAPWDLKLLTLHLLVWQLEWFWFEYLGTVLSK